MLKINDGYRSKGYIALGKLVPNFWQFYTVFTNIDFFQPPIPRPLDH